MFQYATGRALALHYDIELKLDLSFFDNKEFLKVYRLDKFNLPFTIAEESDYIHLQNSSDISRVFRGIKKLGFKFRPFYKKNHILENDVLKLFNSESKANRDYYIEGWLANENYFKNIKEILVSELNADHLLHNENLLLHKEIKNSNSIAVHIRRGDYLNSNYFTTLPKEYYFNAMRNASEKIENPVFYFFSDDIQWTKTNFADFQNVRFVEHNSIADSKWSTSRDIEDLMLMRSCMHQIIANSSFSWWGAWLNKNPEKIVIAPRKWYDNKKAQSAYKSSDFIPKEWIKI